ncbi:MAG TPA: T9SS type A sorting domain-containing protein [Bacteroidia bacterium]|nr:T9SS type A sorting domain-containing protein [Bacteroidia bacterium]
MSIFSIGKAQNYTLVDTGKVWTSTSCGYGWATTCVTNYYKMEQDTVIGSFTYKCVWESGDSGLVNPTWNLQGFMREDSSRKVFYRDLIDNQDSPIYDFGVIAGDTAHLVYGGYQPIAFVVDSTSTIVLQNQTRNVYYLHDPSFSFYQPQTWIEGIGSLNELLVLRAPQVDYSSDLLCFHENDTLKYFNPNYTDCYYNTTGIHEYGSENQISLSPNPTDGKFTIHFLEHSFQGKGTVVVKDVSGKTVWQQEIIANEKAEMDLSQLPSGLYFISITAKGIAPLTGKVAVY